MAEAYCACIISNLEGKRPLGPLPRTDFELGSTLEALDRRTRRLEANVHVTPPPPLLDTSWDSLTWRVCRLSRLLQGSVLRQGPSLQTAASLPLIMSAISTINTQSHLAWSDKEGVDEKELLRIASQWLWRFAGQRGFDVKNPSFELEAVCSLALDLTLEAEPSQYFPGRRLPPPLHPGIRQIPTRVIVPGSRSCCHCCSCNCHDRSRRDPSVSSDASSRRHRRGFPVFGWLKKLAFWRRRRVRDDTSSSSSTLADE